MPIFLAIVMIVLLVVVAVGLVLLAVFGALEDASRSGLYWALLSIGSTFILLLVVGVVLYLILSIKAINLTRRQSNFIDSVTHELKSPIASMKLYLQTLSRHQVSQQMQADFHRFMLEDLERLDHLINQMLDAGGWTPSVRRTRTKTWSWPICSGIAQCRYAPVIGCRSIWSASTCSRASLWDDDWTWTLSFAI